LGERKGDRSSARFGAAARIPNKGGKKQRGGTTREENLKADGEKVKRISGRPLLGSRPDLSKIHFRMGRIGTIEKAGELPEIKANYK